MITKILVANRGEIACRVMRTAARMGIVCVAIYSDVDAQSPHVLMADEAVCIGPAPSNQSYLDQEAIINAAKKTRCDAIHPGYGFLSENANFARACEAEGIRFIGPSADAIIAMGSKSAAKALMEKAGVPILPGYHGDKQDPEFLLKEANKLGYPLLIKAVAGGGGKGMRVVEHERDFMMALEGAKREAKNGFSDDRVLLEKYLRAPRHIEVQIMADTLGTTLHLFERDCSIQRRKQKIIEEAPAPGLSPTLREKLGKTAIEAAKSIHYVGAGTIEFLFEHDQFYFMEMNTRLQVEHPITEKITGLDLVQLQIEIASGKPLSLSQSDIVIHGHAIEVRICAENPDDNYLPATGTVTHYQPPNLSDHTRLDSGISQDGVITVHYDPLLAKLITWGEDRHSAITLMNEALRTFQLAGVTHNMNFLRRILQSSAFSSAPYDTGFLAKNETMLRKSPITPDKVYACAIVDCFLKQCKNNTLAFDRGDAFELNREPVFTLHIDNDGAPLCLQLREKTHSHFVVKINHDRTITLKAERSNNALHLDDALIITVIEQDSVIQVFGFSQQYTLTRFDPIKTYYSDLANEGNLAAPMPGTIIAVFAKVGDCVKLGDPLMILEAMKMEHTILAPHDGIIEHVFFQQHDQVDEGVQLLSFVHANT